MLHSHLGRLYHFVRDSFFDGMKTEDLIYQILGHGLFAFIVLSCLYTQRPFDWIDATFVLLYGLARDVRLGKWIGK